MDEPLGGELDGVTVVVAPAPGDARQAARTLLLDAAAGLLRVPAGALRVDREPGGRPLLVGTDRPLHVSVSHTRGLAVVALSGRCRVGVDVEAVRPLPAAELARRWFPAAEAAWVGDRPRGAQVPALLWLWTHKEAIGKLRGTGLRGGGLAQRVPLPGQGDPAALAPVPGDPAVLVAAPPAPDGYLLAVACETGAAVAAGTRVRVRRGG